ncbi:hypothetical protein D3C79_844530 [compost metagenome]
MHGGFDGEALYRYADIAYSSRPERKFTNQRHRYAVTVDITWCFNNCVIRQIGDHTMVHDVEMATVDTACLKSFNNV